MGKWIKVKSMVIVPAADPRTHSTRVRLYLAGDERDIYPGVYAQAHFAIGHAKKLVIPVQSVIRRSEVSGVYVVNDKGATSFRQIRLGEKTGDGLVEVLAGRLRRREGGSGADQGRHGRSGVEARGIVIAFHRRRRDCLWLIS